MNALAALPLFLVASSLPVPDSPPHRLLLRVETTVTSTLLCSGLRSEAHISADGILVETGETDSGRVIVRRAVAPPDAVVRFRQALMENRIGFARGDCRVDFFQPGDSFETTITWSGRFGRSNSFTVRTVGGTPCSEQTNAIFHAIGELRLAAEEDPAGTTSFMFNPGPPCGPPP